MDQITKTFAHLLLKRRSYGMILLIWIVILSAFHESRVQCRRGETGAYVGGKDFCNYNNKRFIKEGDILQISACETCTCNKTTDLVTCKYHSCKWNFCGRKVQLPGQCCMVCAYYVPVYNIELEDFRIVRGLKYREYHLQFHLRLEINNDGVDVRGDGLWRAGMWVSGNEDGSGKRIGEIYQVLDEIQDSLHITRSQFFGGFNFTIPKVHYDLSAIKEDLCLVFEDRSYLCVEFAAGDDPLKEKDEVPFMVEGVTSAWNLTQDPTRLTKCVPYLLCGAEEDYEEIWITPKPTPPSGCPQPDILNMEKTKHSDELYKYGKMVSLHCKEGYNLVGTGVLVCTNKNTWHRKYPECIREIVVTTKTTLPPTTPMPTKAVVPVLLTKLSVAKTNDVLQISVDVTVRSELDGSTPLEVGTWASANSDGSGKKTGFRKQVVELKPPNVATTPAAVSNDFSDSNASNKSSSSTDGIQLSQIPSPPLTNVFQPAENISNSTETEELQPSNDPASTTPVLGQFQPMRSTVTVTTPSDGPNNTANTTTTTSQKLSTHPESTTITAGAFTSPKQHREVAEYEVSIPHVSFELDTSNTSCDAIKYLCAGIGVGDVNHEYVSHVHSDTNLELVGCEPFTECEDIPVYNVEVLGVDSITAGTNNSIKTTLQISVNGHGRTATQSAFWRVSMWSSTEANGGRDKIGFVKQVLNYKQASESYTRPNVGTYKINILDVTFTLNTVNASCDELKYLCASFGTSDILGSGNESNVISFIVYGASAENDSTPNSDRLIGCSPFTTCNETEQEVVLTSAQPTAAQTPKGCRPPPQFNAKSSIFIWDPVKKFYALNETVKIKCKPGMDLYLHGQDSFTCFVDGIWLGKTPECWIEGCSPPDVANGSFIVPRKYLYTYGQNVTINCREGFLLIGNNTLTCTRDSHDTNSHDGFWFGDIPYCKREGCPRPITGNKSVIDPDQGWYRYGETVHITISCPTGMQVSSHYTEFVCTNNGTWYREIPYCTNQTKKSSHETGIFGKGCLRPTIENEDRIRIEQEWHHCGQKVKITCKAGFHLEGDHTIICCDSGDWYFDVPRCVQDALKLGKPSMTASIGAKQKECRRPVVSTGITLVPDKPVYRASDRVNIVCKQGYQLVGEEHIVCSKTGNWNAQIGHCNLVAQGCKKPKLPIGGRIFPFQKWYSHGQTVKINCSENYQLIGEKELVCSDTGEWHRDIPKCEMSDYLITPLIITMSVACVLLLAVLIVLNCISEDYKPTTPTSQLVHRGRRKTAMKIMMKNNHILRTPSVGPADKCNGIAPVQTSALARWKKV